MKFSFLLRPCCVCVIALCALPAMAQMQRFSPPADPQTEVWKLTDDPRLRHWINYHTTRSFSHDGRYVAIERSEPFTYGSGNSWAADPRTKEIFVFDLATESLIGLGLGEGPRWGKRNNWLFYIEYASGEPNESTRVVRYDLAAQQKITIATGFVRLDETDADDEWIYGRSAAGLATSQGNIFRIRTAGGAAPENVNQEIPTGRIILPNPRQPTVFYRDDGSGSFAGTRYFADPDGSNVQMAYPMLQRSHMSWSGDGQYLLQGHRLVFGRRWNEPFPSNAHILSIVSHGDPSGCGYDGRWVVTSHNIGLITMSDLRSGDYAVLMSTAGSYIHNSTAIDYAMGSDLMDNDAKCSPDGTKVVFVTNYDLENGPGTRVLGHIAGGDTLNVNSTEGFPSAGALTIGREVVGYTAKTATSFLNISRNLYRTTSGNTGGLSGEMIEAYRQRESMKSFLKQYPITKEQVEQMKIVVGEVPTRLRGKVTSFDSRLIPAAQRGVPATRFLEPSFAEPDSELIWQSQTDAYVVVARPPDAPYLRIEDGRVALIPGENHRETRGYYLLLDGVRVSEQLLPPDTEMTLDTAGALSAVAVEWSGLESPPGNSLPVTAGTVVDTLADPPDDFSWTTERWIVAGQEVTAAEAQAAQASVLEIVHHYDGVIHREDWTAGQRVRRDDLAANGETIRRQLYADGRLIRREYHGHGRGLRSTENFDAQGFIDEVIQHNVDGSISSRTLFEQGMPVEHTGGSLMNYGSGKYRKEGESWVKTTKK